MVIPYILNPYCSSVSPKQGKTFAKEGVDKLTAFVYDITQNIACTCDSC